MYVPSPSAPELAAEPASGPYPMAVAVPIPEAVLVSAKPTQLTRVREALGRITSIRINKSVREDGHRLYVIDIDVQPDGGPAVRMRTRHRYHDFSNLSAEMGYHARTNHSDPRARPNCRFCAKVLDALASSPYVPNALKLAFASESTTNVELTNFLRMAWRLAMFDRHSTDATCEGREMVPVLVKKFLLGDDGEIDRSLAGNHDGYLWDGQYSL